MKLILIAASALAFAATPSMAGGFSGSNYAGAPQFASSAASNYAHQLADIGAYKTKGHIDQVTGAAAEAVNESDCGCTGSRTAVAVAKNTSFQVGAIHATFTSGSITQSAVSTALAHNISGH
jgi:hypothetical protein